MASLSIGLSRGGAHRPRSIRETWRRREGALCPELSPNSYPGDGFAAWVKLKRERCFRHRCRCASGLWRTNHQLSAGRCVVGLKSGHSFT